MKFETLPEAVRRYRLRDASVTNADIARRMGTTVGRGDAMGEPGCCFFSDGYLAAIRTNPDEVSVFHIFQNFQNRLGEIADQIE